MPIPTGCASRPSPSSVAGLRDVPAVTHDGVAVSHNMNAGLLVDMAKLTASGADGIGRYRTDYAREVWVGAVMATVRQQRLKKLPMAAYAQMAAIVFSQIKIAADQSARRPPSGVTAM